MVASSVDEGSGAKAVMAASEFLPRTLVTTHYWIYLVDASLGSGGGQYSIRGTQLLTELESVAMLSPQLLLLRFGADDGEEGGEEWQVLTASSAAANLLVREISATWESIFMVELEVTRSTSALLSM